MTNDTEVVTLTDFLLARIAEDEALGRSELSNWPTYDYNGVGDPERWLAECEAKRRLVDLHTYRKSDGILVPFGPDHEWALGIIAAVYDDHPDYDEAWRS